MKKIEAWHFLPVDRKLRHGDNREPRAGETLTVSPARLRLCEHGLHASKKPLDALYYAPGPIACRVELSGKVLQGTWGLCASERTILWWVDATEVLRKFPLLAALDMVQVWNAPGVVVQYLFTQDRNLSAGEVYAAYGAAWNSAWHASRTVEEAAEGRLAWKGAGSATNFTVQAMAEAAACSTTGTYRRAKAKEAVTNQANHRLTRMLYDEHKKQKELS